MKLPSLKQTAMTAISLALAGCAGSDIGKDATALVLQDKTPDKKAANPGLDLRPSTDAAAKDAGPAADVGDAVRQAEALRKSGNLQGAAHTLSQLVLVAPDDARVMGEYGKTLVAEGRSDDALAFLERALELQPGDWSLYSAQGVAFDQKANYKAAQISYGRALSIKPGEPSVLSNDALSHVQTGDLDGAERLLIQASQQGDAYPRIASNLALVKSLRAEAPQGNADAAKTETPSVAGSAAVPNANVEMAPLADPVQGTAVSPGGNVPNSSAEANAGTEALEKDPSVMMQAIPSDAPAKMPVKVAEKHPAPKKPLQTLAADDQRAPLRRLSDSDDRN